MRTVCPTPLPLLTKSKGTYPQTNRYELTDRVTKTRKPTNRTHLLVCVMYGSGVQGLQIHEYCNKLKCEVFGFWVYRTWTLEEKHVHKCRNLSLEESGRAHEDNLQKCREHFSKCIYCTGCTLLAGDVGSLKCEVFGFWEYETWTFEEQKHEQTLQCRNLSLERGLQFSERTHEDKYCKCARGAATFQITLLF